MTCLSEQKYEGGLRYKNIYIVRSRAGLSLPALLYLPLINNMGDRWHNKNHIAEGGHRVDVGIRSPAQTSSNR